MKAMIISAVILVALTAVGATPEDALFDPSTENQVAEGRQLYRIYCSGCHGPQGRGDGPAADDLGPEPADLALIRQNNDGEFHAAKIEATISGLDAKPGHRRREMPLWGFALKETGSDADQTEAVKKRIQALVKYLESIQVGR
jgi:mono/diheme cytochrome c family protein